MSPTSYQTAPPRIKIISVRWWRVKRSSRGHPAGDGKIVTGFQSPGFCTLLSLPGRCTLPIQLLPLARVHYLRWVDGCAVQLFFQNLPIFADQEVDPARGLVLVHIHAVLTRNVSSPVTQEREGDADGIGEGFVGEGAVHAHTQNLGVGGFQLLQILLEGLHLFRSTTGKGKNIEREHDVFLASVLAERNVFQIVAIEILQFKVGRLVADFELRPRWLRAFSSQLS